MYPASAGPSYPQPVVCPPAPSGYGQPGINPSAVGEAYPLPGYPAPITNPPAGYPPPRGNEANWMPAPVGVPVGPPGLQYLSTIDQLLVQQKIELLEVLSGLETENKYLVKNSMGQQVFWAIEESDCCSRNCLGASRPFDIKIADNFGNEVIHLSRPFNCGCCCCCPCCLQEMEVTAPPGTVIGSIVQEWTCFTPSFRVQDAGGDTALRIEGPCVACSCCGDVPFKVLSRDGSKEVGCIRKQWSGFAREAATDADNFGITFPLDLDVNIKAVLLGACMLIDFMFFENQQNNRQRNF